MNHFKNPYFITPHAVKRFQEEVANIPASLVIFEIQKALQEPRNLIEFEIRNEQFVPIFACQYKGFIYYVPVIKGKKEWPAVPTIHGRESIIHERIKRGKKKTCGIYQKQMQLLKQGDDA